jgi:hypothetical protein
MFFANEQRENVRDENPGITFGMSPRSDLHLHCNLPTAIGQVGKVLGERWKALNDKQRAPYEAKAVQDKKRYEDEKASYNVSADEPVGCRGRRIFLRDFSTSNPLTSRIAFWQYPSYNCGM